jgi:hypothetical protein
MARALRRLGVPLHEIAHDDGRHNIVVMVLCDSGDLRWLRLSACLDRRGLTGRAGTSCAGLLWLDPKNWAIRDWWDQYADVRRVARYVVARFAGELGRDPQVVASEFAAGFAEAIRAEPQVQSFWPRCLALFRVFRELA